MSPNIVNIDAPGPERLRNSNGSTIFEAWGNGLRSRRAMCLAHVASQLEREHGLQSNQGKTTDHIGFWACPRGVWDIGRRPNLVNIESPRPWELQNSSGGRLFEARGAPTQDLARGQGHQDCGRPGLMFVQFSGSKSGPKVESEEVLWAGAKQNGPNKSSAPRSPIRKFRIDYYDYCNTNANINDVDNNNNDDKYQGDTPAYQNIIPS